MKNIEQLFNTGDKVQYRVGDKWRDGVVHGVSKGEDAKGRVVSLSYLVDTGKDERVDKYPYNPRDVEFNKRVHKLIDDGAEVQDALAEVEKHKDLPKSANKVEIVRQPKQVAVLPDDIRAVK